MTLNTFNWSAILRRDVVAGLIVLLSLPAHCKEPQVKTLLDQIYRHYIGSSVGEGKGVALTDPKIVRGYFTMGLASLIIEDRAVETRRGEQPALDGDPFVGHPEWDISNLAIDVKETGPFRATGTVTFTNGGKPEKIVLELQRFGPDWRIADIEWQSGSLRGTFRRKAAYRIIAVPR
jgi:hypothetical protein